MLELLTPGAVDVRLEDYPKVAAWVDELRRLPKWDEIHSAMLKIVQKRQSKL